MVLEHLLLIYQVYVQILYEITCSDQHYVP